MNTAVLKTGPLASVSQELLNVSHGSVAAHSRCGGIVSDDLGISSLWSLEAKGQ